MQREDGTTTTVFVCVWRPLFGLPGPSADLLGIRRVRETQLTQHGMPLKGSQHQTEREEGDEYVQHRLYPPKVVLLDLSFPCADSSMIVVQSVVLLVYCRCSSATLRAVFAHPFLRCCLSRRRTSTGEVSLLTPVLSCCPTDFELARSLAGCCIAPSIICLLRSIGVRWCSRCVDGMLARNFGCAQKARGRCRFLWVRAPCNYEL